MKASEAGPASGRHVRPGRRPPSGSAERARIREGILYCLKVFLALRLGLFVLGLVATAIFLPHSSHPGVLPPPVDVPGWPAHEITPGWHNLFTSFERQDALWFLRIATDGYAVGDGSAAFFPLYPLVVQLFSFGLGGHPLAAALLVSNVAFLGALIVLYFLTASELSEPAARRTVLYLAVFPTSFFFLAPYSESLFLLLAVSSFWAARRRRWALAGILGALAAATRSVGVLLAPALAFEAVHQWWEARAHQARAGPAAVDPGRAPLSRDGSVGTLVARLLWSAGVALGLLAYFLYWKIAFGDLSAPYDAQKNWDRVAVMPWQTIWRATKDAFQFAGQYAGGYHQLDWLVVMPGLALAAYALWRFRPAYGLFTWASLLVPLSYIFEGRPFMSMPRFLLPLFPIFWSLAVLAERRRLPHSLIVGVSAAGLGLLTVLYVNWYFTF